MNNHPLCDGGCCERLSHEEYAHHLSKRGRKWHLCFTCETFICPSCGDELAELPGADCLKCQTAVAIFSEIQEIMQQIPSFRGQVGHA